MARTVLELPDIRACGVMARANEINFAPAAFPFDGPLDDRVVDRNSFARNAFTRTTIGTCATENSVLRAAQGFAVFIWIVLSAIALSGCAHTTGASESESTQLAAGPVSELTRLENAVQVSPGDPVAHYDLGNAYFDLGRFREAENAYSKAVALRPEYAAAHCNLGLAQRRMGRIAEAIASYHTALQHEPDDPTSIQNLVAALRETGDFESAAALLTRLAELQPDDVLVWSQLGNLLFRLDRYAEAANAYKEVIRLDPGMSSDYYNLGLCYLEQENFDAALTTWLTALAYNPDNASARKGLAVAYWKRGDYAQAWLAVIECQSRSIPLDAEFIRQLQDDSGQVGPAP